MFKKIFQNSAKLMLGHAIGQSIVFLSGPLLSRIYSPEQFGKYVLLSSIAGILSVMSTGGYEFAITTVKQKDEAQKLAFVSVSLSFITSIFSTIILLILFLSSEAWKKHVMGAGWALIPIFVLLQGIYNTTVFLMNRDERYGIISFSRTSRSAIMVPLQILWGIKNISWGLFAGMVIGQLISAAILLRKVIKSPGAWLKIIKKVNFKSQLKKQKSFPLYIMPQEITNSISSQIPVFFLSYFFSQAALGLYALPHKFLSAPIFLIGNSLGRVYLRDASLSLENETDLAQTSLKLFRFLFRLGILPFSILCVFGDLITEFFFGSQWQESGIYAMILSPWLFFVLIGSSLSNIFIAKGKQKLSFKINIFMLVARSLAFSAGVFLFKSPVISVSLFSGISLLFWVYIAFYNLHLAKIKIFPIALESISIWIMSLMLLVLIRNIVL